MRRHHGRHRTAVDVVVARILAVRIGRHTGRHGGSAGHCIAQAEDTASGCALGLRLDAGKGRPRCRSPGPASRTKVVPKAASMGRATEELRTGCTDHLAGDKHPAEDTGWDHRAVAEGRRIPAADLDRSAGTRSSRCSTW